MTQENNNYTPMIHLPILGPKISYKPNIHMQDHIEELSRNNICTSSHMISQMKVLEEIIQTGGANPEIFAGEKGKKRLFKTMAQMDYTQEGKYHL